ncbi:ATP-binding protein [Rugamonas rubra]|uniref:histidine kinase n=1 Tax=Rugamonas rubra TaxID=758825 RepID=A0A1I4SEN6_9BURK|nr:ATP-binding protein [Rugamonas rubra]SFM62958.1 His Kinase A (phospho-acceptor) domain-containing protein [Rugamonas rubra]
MEALNGGGGGGGAAWRRLLPRSLRRQFSLVVAGLTLLILAGGVTAVYALRVGSDATDRLAEERMLRMQDAQDLVRRTLLIERESDLLAGAASAEAVRARYGGIAAHLESFDHLADRLAAAGDEGAILDLRQASQLFRNSANVVAQLREAELQAAAAPTPAAAAAAAARARPFQDQLRHQAAAMAAAAQLQSERHSQDFRDAAQALRGDSLRHQRWVAALLAASLLLAWLASYHFLGRHVLSRLQLVSDGLRRREPAEAEAGESAPALAVAVAGGDEIGEMARAVEQFQADRRQLSLAHAALERERGRQQQLIDQLAQVHGQLLQSEKLASVGQLAAGMAHEINNPVGFVNANLGTLRAYVADLLDVLAAYEAVEAELGADSRAALAELKRRIDLPYLRGDIASLLGESLDGLRRVKRIVQDLKDFALVDETELQWANLEDALDSAVNVVHGQLKFKGELRREYAAIPAVECRPLRLNQVFLNLLRNAADAAGEHGRITLRTGRDDAQVWVEVEDNGDGIRQEHLDRLFDPFFTTKPVGSGTGLGLSMAYGIVKTHGGRIEVRSEPGRGAAFRVVLPRQAGGQT